MMMILIVTMIRDTEQDLFNLNNIRFHLRYPTTRDPYESRTAEVRESRIAGAGEGLFAVRDIGAGETVAYFAGVRLPATETSSRSDYSILMGINDDYEQGQPFGDCLLLSALLHRASSAAGHSGAVAVGTA